METPDIFPKTLQEFKAWLARPGVRIRGIRHGGVPAARFFDDRAITEVTNTSFTTDDGFTANFRSAKAWVFNPQARTATLTLSPETLHGPARQVVYKLIDPKP